MLMLALTAVLSTTPMPPSVAGWAEGKFGIGHGHGLSGPSGPDPAWLLDDAGKAWIAVDLLTKAEILAEIELLTAKQRGFGRPTFLLVTAFFVVLVGAIVSIAGGISLFLGAPIVTLVAGLVCIGVGLVLVILGIADALAVVANQNRYGHRIGELKRRLEALDAVTRAPLPEAMFTIARF